MSTTATTTYRCEVCLLDWDEPYCGSCGHGDLKVNPEINRPAGLSFEASAQPGSGGKAT